MIPMPKESRLEDLAAALDSVTHQERVDWLRSLNKGQQAALFELAEGTQMGLEEVHFYPTHMLAASTYINLVEDDPTRQTICPCE